MPKEMKSRRKKCPSCGSTQTYVRIKTLELVCTRCTAVTPLTRVKQVA